MILLDGLKDLREGIIRAVGDANERFQEDGLRIMRGARFAARFGYKVDPNTLSGMKTSVDTLRKVSKERISDELRKILMSDYPSYGLNILRDCGAIYIACPLFTDRQWLMFNNQDECEGDLEVHLALLYNRVPSKLVERELIELKFSSKEIKRTIFLLLKRAAFVGFEQSQSVVSYRQFIAGFKNETADEWVHTLNQFINFASALGLPVYLLHQYRDVQVPARKDLAINGNDLMAAGITAGPDLKMWLDTCYREVLEHPEHNNKEYLLKRLNLI